MQHLKCLYRYIARSIRHNVQRMCNLSSRETNLKLKRKKRLKGKLWCYLTRSYLIEWEKETKVPKTNVLKWKILAILNTRRVTDSHHNNIFYLLHNLFAKSERSFFSSSNHIYLSFSPFYASENFSAAVPLF